jgi:hypothetical protein
MRCERPISLWFFVTSVLSFSEFNTENAENIFSAVTPTQSYSAVLN